MFDLRKSNSDLILLLDDAPSIGVHMARQGNTSDLVVAALSADRTQVLVRQLSLCGNGIVDVNEQCDGTAYCDNQCMCMGGTEYRNGQCVDGT